MIATLGKNAALAVEILGDASRFYGIAMGKSVSDTIRLRLSPKAVLDQIYSMGVIATPSTLLSLVFLTSVMVTELSFHMSLIVRQDAMVPSFTALLVIRELGPVVTAMLSASRIGGAIAAELSTLKTTGQLDALILCGVDPMRYWVVPRILGGLVSMVALNIIAVGGALFLSGLITSNFLGLTPTIYFSHLFLFTSSSDFGCSIVKAALFGLLIPLVGSRRGLSSERGSAGVGIAATRSVVENSIGIILLDFLVSTWWYAV